MPLGSKAATRALLLVMISPGASLLKIAIARCFSSKDVTNARPRSSSSAMTRKPVLGPVRTSPGLLPMKEGVKNT